MHFKKTIQFKTVKVNIKETTTNRASDSRQHQTMPRYQSRRIYAPPRVPYKNDSRNLQHPAIICQYRACTGPMHFKKTIQFKTVKVNIKETTTKRASDSQQHQTMP